MKLDLEAEMKKEPARHAKVLCAAVSTFVFLAYHLLHCSRFRLLAGIGR
jgi:hypothetical protein